MSIILFIIGLFIGSFLLVVVDRFPKGESILWGRSHCDMCDHTLSWYDLFPIVSYITLKGKCRYCHKPFGVSYPVIEVVTGLLFATIPIFFPLVSLPELLILCIISGCSIVVFFCDVWYGLIPDNAVLILGVSGILLGIIHHTSLLSLLLSSLGAGVFFLLLYLGTKRKGMGLGDVKLSFAMGLVLGYPFIILAFYIAFLTGALVALILIIGRRKKFKGDSIPFGPFLIIGMISVLLGGNYLWNLSLHLLFHL